MRKLLLAAAALLISGAAFGQFGNIDWGVKAGMNISGLTNADGIMGMGNSKMKPSIYLGLFAEFPLYTDFIAVQPELIYSRQGNRYESGGVKVWDRVNYLNIPVMFKFYVLEKLSVDVGPQFGFRLNAKTKIKNGSTEKHSLTDDFKGLDLSFGMGASYKINETIDVSFRYNLGLTKAYKYKNDGDKVKNSVIQLGAGYRF